MTMMSINNVGFDDDGDDVEYDNHDVDDNCYND